MAEQHKITWMGHRRLKCSCAEVFEIEPNTRPGSMPAYNRLLDLHAEHRAGVRECVS